MSKENFETVGDIRRIEDELHKKCIILQYVSDTKGSSHEECILLNKEINELQRKLYEK